LDAAGFEKTLGFKWGLKGYKKGLGHKEFKTVPQQALPEINPDTEIRLSSQLWKHDRKRITGSLLHGVGMMSRLYSSIRDMPKGRCNYYENKGRQFFVMARKIKSI